MSGAAAGEPRLSDTVGNTIGKAPVMMKPSGGRPECALKRGRSLCVEAATGWEALLL